MTGGILLYPKTLPKMNQATKEILYNKCMDYVLQRITRAKTAMDEAQNAANAESKSSAGDKFETGRAMMQLERDKNAKQLQEAILLKNTLEQVQIHQASPTVKVGSLVSTTQGNYFLAISLGKVDHEEKRYYAISAQSPIGQVLIGQPIGATVHFNNRAFTIEAIL